MDFDFPVKLLGESFPDDPFPLGDTGDEYDCIAGGINIVGAGRPFDHPFVGI